MKRRALLVVAVVGALAVAIAVLRAWAPGGIQVAALAPTAPVPPRAESRRDEPAPLDAIALRLPASRSQDGFGHRVVLRDESGAPVVGAQVWLEDEALPLTSDADGSVRLPDSTSSGLVLAEGFAPRIVRGSSAQGVRLQRDHGLRLSLVWEDGEPIRGAAVTAFFPDALLDPARVARLCTPIDPSDADGACLLRPHRLESHAAVLRIDPPRGSRAWVALPAGLDSSDAEARHELRLPRGDLDHRVRLVDAHGRALAGRSVTLHHGVSETTRTAPDGVARFAPRLGHVRTVARVVTGYSVELDPVGSRWYVEHSGPPQAGAEVELEVAPVDVHGHVLTPAPDSYRVASFAVTVDERVQRTWPRRSDVDVIWVPLGPDGTFGPLPGWQGPTTRVAVRHKDHEEILDFELVPVGGGPVELEVPDVCRVKIEVDGRSRSDAQLSWTERSQGDPIEDESIAVRRTFGPTFLVDVPFAGGEIELPCGEYAVLLTLAGSRTDRFEVDATGATATLRLSYPELVRVDVRISSSLRGPIAALPLSIRSSSGGAARSARTDADGRVVLEFPALGPILIEPEWGEDRVRGSDGLTLDPERPRAHFVIEEALLNIVESPPSPQLAAGKLWLKGTLAEGGRSTGKLLVRLGKERRCEYLVAPGTYVLSRRFDARRVQTVESTLAANEERDAVLDCSNLAALALSVTVADPTRSQLRFVARTPNGSLAAFATERTPDDEPWFVLEVVEPGLYSVEVESRTRGAKQDESPRDHWRGELQAVPGAQVPLRIHLR